MQLNLKEEATNNPPTKHSVVALLISAPLVEEEIKARKKDERKGTKPAKVEKDEENLRSGGCRRRAR
jgi:hypothetical protein